eukprot:536499-Pyramimonas_sp.AAC.1
MSRSYVGPYVPCVRRPPSPSVKVLARACWTDVEVDRATTPHKLVSDHVDRLATLGAACHPSAMQTNTCSRVVCSIARRAAR